MFSNIPLLKHIQFYTYKLNMQPSLVHKILYLKQQFRRGFLTVKPQRNNLLSSYMNYYDSIVITRSPWWLLDPLPPSDY